MWSLLTYSLILAFFRKLLLGLDHLSFTGRFFSSSADEGGDDLLAAREPETPTIDLNFALRAIEMDAEAVLVFHHDSIGIDQLGAARALRRVGGRISTGPLASMPRPHWAMSR